MKPNQAEHVQTRVVDLRNRLEDVKSLLYSVAVSDHLADSARTSLGTAIRHIQSVSEDLASFCEEPGGDPPDRSFLESRASEARSEVDSGEFDMHG